jgi:hypothetical protein
MRAAFGIFSLAFLVLATIHPAPAAEPIVWADGTRDNGKLLSIDANWKCVFQVGDRQVTRAAIELIKWGKLSAPQPEKTLLFLAGDRGAAGLVAELLRTTDGKLHLSSAAAGDVSLPLSMVRGIIWQGAGDLARWEKLLNRPEADAQADRVALSNADELTGRFAGLSDEHLTWRGASGQLRLAIDRVAAVGFAAGASPKTPGGLRAIVGLADGSRVVAQKLLVSGETATVHLADEVELRVPVRQVIFVQPLGGRATYLSDLTSASYRHVPFFNVPWDYRRDRNVVGGSLVAGGVTYAKGLGLHSASRLSYSLDRPYQRFETEIAIDDHAAPHGSVVFRVFTDTGDGRWQSRYASPAIRGGASPIAVSVDVRGAKRLSLLVDYADFGDMMDRADWLDARLIE